MLTVKGLRRKVQTRIRIKIRDCALYRGGITGLLVLPRRGLAKESLIGAEGFICIIKGFELLNV